MKGEYEYVQRTEPVFGWVYTGQPKSQWPKWFKAHYSGMFASGTLDKQIGRYAVAVVQNERKTFWRWFDADNFHALYIKARP